MTDYLNTFKENNSFSNVFAYNHTSNNNFKLLFFSILFYILFYIYIFLQFNPFFEPSDRSIFIIRIIDHSVVFLFNIQHLQVIEL